MSSSSVGKAGELRVASELLLRGHRPMLSIVDDGVDITLETMATLQVKACHTVTQKNRGKQYYVFTFHTLHEKRDVNGRRKKKQKMAADFAVLWCIGAAGLLRDSLFFIIPQAAIGQRHTVNIPADDGSSCMWNKYLDKWDLLEAD